MDNGAGLGKGRPRQAGKVTNQAAERGLLLCKMSLGDEQL